MAKEKNFMQKWEEYQAEKAARPVVVKVLDVTYSFLRFRLPEKVKHILARKYPITKEHRQIGLTYWDRPKMIFDYFNADYSLAWNTYPSLVRFRHAEKIGVPMDFANGEDCNIDDWNNALDKMIFAFAAIINNDEMSPKYSIEQTQILSNKIQEGLDLYAKHFRDLWD